MQDKFTLLYHKVSVSRLNLYRTCIRTGICNTNYAFTEGGAKPLTRGLSRNGTRCPDPGLSGGYGGHLPRRPALWNNSGRIFAAGITMPNPKAHPPVAHYRLPCVNVETFGAIAPA